MTILRPHREEAVAVARYTETTFHKQKKHCSRGTTTGIDNQLFADITTVSSECLFAAGENKTTKKKFVTRELAIFLHFSFRPMYITLY